MKYFGIKTPNKELEKSYISWISSSDHKSWRLFFQYPTEDGGVNYHRSPMHDAIRAYKAIGYMCVELNISEA